MNNISITFSKYFNSINCYLTLCFHFLINIKVIYYNKYFKFYLLTINYLFQT